MGLSDEIKKQQQEALMQQYRNEQNMREYEARKKKFGIKTPFNIYNKTKNVANTLDKFGVSKPKEIMNNLTPKFNLNATKTNMLNNPNSVANNIPKVLPNASPTLTNVGANTAPTLSNFGATSANVAPTLSNFGTAGATGAGATGAGTAAGTGMSAIGNTIAGTAGGTATTGLGTIGGTVAGTAGAGTAAGAGAAAGTAAASGGAATGAATAGAAGAATAASAAVPVLAVALIAKQIYDGIKAKNNAKAARAASERQAETENASAQSAINAMQELEQNKQEATANDPFVQQMQQANQQPLSPQEEIMQGILNNQQPTIDAIPTEPMTIQETQAEPTIMDSEVPVNDNRETYMSIIDNALKTAPDGYNPSPVEQSVVENVVDNTPQIPDAKESIMQGIKDKWNNAKTSVGTGMKDLTAGFNDNVNESLMEGDFMNQRAEDKSLMERIGEGAGTAYKVLNNPAVQGGIAGIAYNARNNDPIKALEFGMQYAGNKQKSDMYNKLLAKETGEPYRPNFFGGLTKDDYSSVTGANYKANSLLLRQQMNQLRQDKDFPVYKDWLDAELMAGKITDTEYNQLVKDADAKGTLFDRRNRAALQQIYKNMVDNRRLTETERHNEATEDIQQQNADTREGQYKETVRNNNVKNNQTQQKINIAQSKEYRKTREDYEEKKANGQVVEMKAPDGTIAMFNKKYKDKKIKEGWVEI